MQLRHGCRRSLPALRWTHRELGLAGLAQRFGRSPGYFSRLIRLNYLAPDIIAAIADGTQPPTLDRKTLASADISRCELNMLSVFLNFWETCDLGLSIDRLLAIDSAKAAG